MVLKERLGFLFGLRRKESGQFLHQAAFAAGGIVRVNNAFLGCFVQRADRQHDIFLCFGSALCERAAGGCDGSTGRTAEVAVVDATLFILTIAFDL